MGSLLNDDNEKNPSALPFQSFIVTPLLPCGMADCEVMKFTGNSGLGLAKDLMTQVIHTFSHFAYVYSQNNLYFCDLQGMTDEHRVMTLFDPQCHL